MSRAKVNQDINLKDYNDVWVIGEQRDGVISPITVELLGEGRKLADALGKKLVAVIAGADLDEKVKELQHYGADSIIYVKDKLLAKFSTEGYALSVARVIREKKPEIVLFGATSLGRDIAPRVAAKIGTGLTADCTKLAIDPEDKKFLQTRPAFGGNLMATIICPKNRPQMATVRPGVMEKAPYNEKAGGQLEIYDPGLTEKDIRAKLIDTKSAGKKLVNLTGAKIIVSGGRGLKKPENFKLIEELAEALGGEVGASRAAVDSGWIDQSHQVGQTGTTVRPNVYIACGISGAIQHLAGMSESKYIVAINKDPGAPIFKVCDYGIVGDLNEIVPAITEAAKKRKL
ncbi:MAG: electron transfer flavoprotein subunit alpha/FixB family protein [Fusobacteriaceae bacterium]|jgi:electron transfer flavoprotein alpha subunit|nr:electron transfer flavoprotein subunit alpha/FixB family protein [Fusobacteriaceae bacterium]